MQKDLMTPVERAQALREGKAYDRLPVVIYDNIIAAKIAGMSYEESESSAENIARKLTASFERYGHDAVTLIYSIKALVLQYGAEVNEAHNGPSSIVKYPLDTIDQVSQLNLVDLSIDDDANTQRIYQAAQFIQKEIGTKTFTRLHIRAPFSAAAGFIEPEKLLKATRKNPVKVHQLLEFSTAVLKKVIAHFATIDNLYFSLGDPVASGSLISPKLYAEFCLPYTQELTAYIHSFNKAAWLHICGDTTKMLEMIRETGVDAFSLDQVVDLNLAKQELGDVMKIIGNVDPVNILLNGTPADVTQAVQTCFEQAGGSPQGFYIGPGCDVPYDTPLENLDAFVAASKKYGKVDVVE